jgi:hypothetical protein
MKMARVSSGPRHSFRAGIGRGLPRCQGAEVVFDEAEIDALIELGEGKVRS